MKDAYPMISGLVSIDAVRDAEADIAKLSLMALELSNLVTTERAAKQELLRINADTAKRRQAWSPYIDHWN